MTDEDAAERDQGSSSTGGLDLDLGGAVTLALLNLPEWAHRKVESLGLLPGQRGRRRLSLDCTPTYIPWSDPARPDDQSPPPIVVPLTLMAKEVLRDLDVLDDSGRALPVLGSEANGTLAASAIAFMVNFSCGPDAVGENHGLIQRIARAGTDVAIEAAEELISKLGLDDKDFLGSLLIRDLAGGFILSAILPADRAGVRTVIKWAYHWDTGRFTPSWPRGLGWLELTWKTTAAGTGHIPLHIVVDLNWADYAHSYHLECQAPMGIVCKAIALPADTSGVQRVDRTTGPVAHINGNFNALHRARAATVTFALDTAGALTRTVITAFFMSALFAVLLLWGHSYDRLHDALDPATSLLLFLPALLIALNARGVENFYVSRFLLPVRVMSGLLALMLVSGGVLLVLDASEEVTGCYWAASFVVSTVIFLVTVTGYVRLVVGSHE